MLSLALKDHPHLFSLSYSFRQCKCTYGSKTCRLCGRTGQKNIGLEFRTYGPSEVEQEANERETNIFPARRDLVCRNVRISS